MRLQLLPFEQIKSGSKSIEARVNDDKRQLLRVGDEIVFSLLDDSSQKINTQIINLQKFPNFKELFAAFSPDQYGSVNKDEYVGMYKYYSKDEEVKYGVIAIITEKIVRKDTI